MLWLLDPTVASHMKLNCVQFRAPVSRQGQTTPVSQASSTNMTSSPSQSAPPFNGWGLVQYLRRILVKVEPQVEPHDQASHSVQTPSVGAILGKKSFKLNTHWIHHFFLSCQNRTHWAPSHWFGLCSRSKSGKGQIRLKSDYNYWTMLKCF